MDSDLPGAQGAKDVAQCEESAHLCPITPEIREPRAFLSQ
jgi:hypothetical protein